jgi:xylulokinase
LSLLGIDVGTNGCKVAAYSEDGRLLAMHSEEYQIQKPKPGWAQLDSVEVWDKVKHSIISVAKECAHDPIKALSVSSLGEAVVPVTAEWKILGPSILFFDARGSEFLDELRGKLDDRRLYSINGNTLGNQYGLTKLMWIHQHQPELYQKADKFLLWSSFISFMLGAHPVVDYSLANRTLLFDLHREEWSEDLIALAKLDRAKLPDTYPSGSQIGSVSAQMADELGLPEGVMITAGAHDQNACALGCGVIKSGSAVYGMGTSICITPVFENRLPARQMMQLGLNTEHHAIPGKFVCFIYNQGGSIVKWFRNTFDHDRELGRSGDDVYHSLFAEIPEGPSKVIVLPHFTVTGPPNFIDDSSGVMAGLDLDTRRGDMLKGIIEGVTFSLKEVVDSLDTTGIEIAEYRPVGGGSKSEAWIQTSANIFGKPFKLPLVKEAGTLGAAIIAGVGSGVYTSFDEGVEASVKLERVFEPDMRINQRYQAHYDAFKQLWPLMGEYLRKITALNR